MQRKRKVTSISFRTPEKHEEAVAKARQRKRSLSGQIQFYFDNLPHLEESP